MKKKYWNQNLDLEAYFPPGLDWKKAARSWCCGLAGAFLSGMFWYLCLYGLAKADLYVSTSLSESFPLVINEAKALGIPVVSNDFGSAAESVENEVDGWITSIEGEKMSCLISELIDCKISLPKSASSLEDENKRILTAIYQVL